MRTVVTVDRSVGHEEDWVLGFGSAGIEREDLIMTFADEKSAGNALRTSRGIASWYTGKGIQVRRKPVPICPALAVTASPIQGATRQFATHDLKDGRTSQRRDWHRECCSTYAQISRLRSRSGLHLLQVVELRSRESGIGTT